MLTLIIKQISKQISQKFNKGNITKKTLTEGLSQSDILSTVEYYLVQLLCSG